MKNWKSLIVAVVMLGFAASAVAQPAIGVYFDDQATTTALTGALNTFYTGYVMVTGAEMMLGGAAFQMNTEGGFSIFNTIWAPGVLFGGLTTGAELALYDYVPVFGTDAAQLCSFMLSSPTAVNNSHITIAAHPNYATPVVSNNVGVLYEASGEVSSVSLRQTPEIGLFWDEAGTQDSATQNGGVTEVHTGYILVRNAEMMVGGAAFKLTLDPRIMVMNTVWAPGVVLGTVTAGAEIGLYNYVPVFGSDVCLIATVAMTTFNELMADAELIVEAHPNYDTPKVADNNAVMWTANGHTSHLTIVVPTESMSWGQVKSLY